MPVASDAEHDLLGRKASRSPCLDCRNSGPLLICCRCTGIIQRGVRANRVGPASPNIVVHKGHIIQDFGELGYVGRRISARIVEGNNSGSGRENEVGFSLAKSLQEREEVGRILCVDDIAASSLLIRILPATPGSVDDMCV